MAKADVMTSKGRMPRTSAAASNNAPSGGAARFLLLGWCFTQSVRPVRIAEAQRRGVVAEVDIGFPEDAHLARERAPDCTVKSSLSPHRAAPTSTPSCSNL